MYLQDYWSINRTSPPKDTVNNFELVEATEMAGYTSVKFERNLTTGEANLDVQFTVKLYINKLNIQVTCVGELLSFTHQKCLCEGLSTISSNFTLHLI